MKKIIYIIIISVWFLGSRQPVYALVSPHPIQLYEKGERMVTKYNGDIATLVAAQDVFMELIEKYPSSPFGYLGMSHIYRIDAYLGDENYDLTLIRERALPFALKALRLGPSIRAVHENYAFFEQFLDGASNAASDQY